jgi:hypothetical protein
LRRHDLNSVFDSAKIRWIDIIVNRRYQKCCPDPVTLAVMDADGVETFW